MGKKNNTYKLDFWKHFDDYTSSLLKIEKMTNVTTGEVLYFGQANYKIKYNMKDDFIKEYKAQIREETANIEKAVSFDAPINVGNTEDIQEVIKQFVKQIDEDKQKLLLEIRKMVESQLQELKKMEEASRPAILDQHGNAMSSHLPNEGKKIVKGKF